MPELRAIGSELRARLGDAGKTSPSYIASVLREAGTRIEIPERLANAFMDPSMEEPYATRLRSLLQFGNFASAEQSLRDLDRAYREYSAAADRLGMKLVRAVALKGKLRAQSLASHPRVTAAAREEKREIAGWFRVWLQSPDLFWAWLELRKESEEFQRKFEQPAAHDGG
jgi:hypothetical protein